MKIIKILGHPYTVVISFMLLLISGEHFGGFYILYVLLGLPHGAIHSILPIPGMVILLFKNHKKIVPGVSVLLNLVGLIFLLLSLFFFFYNDPSHYNAATFAQTVPLATFILFGVFVICSMVSNFLLLFQTGLLNE